jgi:hypothetical protein
MGNSEFALRLPFFDKPDRFTSTGRAHFSIHNRALGNCNFFAGYRATDSCRVAYFNATRGHDVSLNGAGHDYHAGLYGPLPMSVPGKCD